MMLNDGSLNIYIHGDAEYHVLDRISIKGDGYYFLGTQSRTLLQQHHGIFFGSQYHLPLRNFAPFIGMQPGISCVDTRKSSLPSNDNESGDWAEGAIVPMISFAAGFNWYVWKFLHFSGQVRYLHGNHAMTCGNLTLDDFKLSAGLGWNVNVIRTGKRNNR